MSKEEFKTWVITEAVPRIKKMIEIEEKHLIYLQSFNNLKLQKEIESSELHLKMFKKSLIDYENYGKNS